MTRRTTTAQRHARRCADRVALAMTGVAALGMEILWFRHFNILLGGFRAVFSLLLALILVGIGAGSFIGGACSAVGTSGRMADDRAGAVRGVDAFGFAWHRRQRDQQRSARAGAWIASPAGARAGAVGALAELWFNAKPMLAEIGIPALLMGFSFPLGNAVIQHAERSVAGVRACCISPTPSARCAAAWS